MPGNNADGCSKPADFPGPGNCSYPDRHHFNAVVTQQDLRDSYTPMYEAATKAGAAAMMCSYNVCKVHRPLQTTCSPIGLPSGSLRSSFVRCAGNQWGAFVH